MAASPLHAIKMAYNTPLTDQQFKNLLERAARSNDVHYAHEDPVSLSLMNRPKSLSVLAMDGDRVVGLAKGMHFGEYVYLSYMGVDKAYYGNGIGSKLIKMFRDQAWQLTGPVSIVMLSADPQNLKHPLHRFALNRGFRPLPSALYLKRYDTLTLPFDESSASAAAAYNNGNKLNRSA